MDDTPIHTDAHKEDCSYCAFWEYAWEPMSEEPSCLSYSHTNGLVITSIISVGKSAMGWNGGHFSKWNVDWLLYFLESFGINRDWESSDIRFYSVLWEGEKCCKRELTSMSAVCT